MTILSSIAAAERVFSILNSKPQSDDEDAVNFKEFKSQIEYKNVNFSRKTLFVCNHHSFLDVVVFKKILPDTAVVMRQDISQELFFAFQKIKISELKKLKLMTLCLLMKQQVI